MSDCITAAALLHLAKQYGVVGVQGLALLAERRGWEWRPKSASGERISGYDPPEKPEKAA